MSQGTGTTQIYPRDASSYRVLAVMNAYPDGVLSLRNLAAIKGSLSNNLQRIIFQENQLPRQTLKLMVHSTLGLTVPEQSCRLVNRERTEITAADIAAFDLVLLALGVENPFGFNFAATGIIGSAMRATLDTIELMLEWMQRHQSPHGGEYQVGQEKASSLSQRSQQV